MKNLLFILLVQEKNCNFVKSFFRVSSLYSRKLKIRNLIKFPFVLLGMESNQPVRFHFGKRPVHRSRTDRDLPSGHLSDPSRDAVAMLRRLQAVQDIETGFRHRNIDSSDPVIHIVLQVMRFDISNFDI